MPGTERERVPTFGHPDVGLKGPTPWHHCANLSERAWGTVGGQPGGWVPCIIGGCVPCISGRCVQRAPRAREALSGSGANRHPE